MIERLRRVHHRACFGGYGVAGPVLAVVLGLLLLPVAAWGAR